MDNKIKMNNAEASDTSTLASSVTEYKFGHTTYIVELHFCSECKETLEDVVRRLIVHDVERVKKTEMKP